MQPGFRQARIEFERAPCADQRVTVLMQSQQGMCQIIVCVGVIGECCRRLLPDLQCLGEFAAIVQYRAEHLPAERMRRKLIDKKSGRDFGGERIAPLVNPEQQFQPRRAGLTGADGSLLQQRGVYAVTLRLRDSKMRFPLAIGGNQGINVAQPVRFDLGGKPSHPLQEGQRFFRAPALQQQQAEIVIGIRLSWLLPEDDPILALGLFHAPGTMMRNGLLKDAIER